MNPTNARGVKGRYVPDDAQLIGLMEGSGISESRPVGQQLDLLVAWARRCMTAWDAAGVGVPQGVVRWCAEFQRADGTAAGRWEFFTSEERANSYATRSRANGARMRVFKMVEVPDGVPTPQEGQQ